MKQTILNRGQDTVEVQYTRKDGSTGIALINPGRASLPEDAVILNSHPDIRVYDAYGSPLTAQTPVVTPAPAPVVQAAVAASEPAVEVVTTDSKGTKK